MLAAMLICQHFLKACVEFRRMYFSLRVVSMSRRPTSDGKLHSCGRAKAMPRHRDEPRPHRGKWTGCLQTAINWAWLVCHHLPISCALLSLPEMAGEGGRLKGACTGMPKSDRDHLWPRRFSPTLTTNRTGKTKHIHVQANCWQHTVPKNT